MTTRYCYKKITVISSEVERSRKPITYSHTCKIALAYLQVGRTSMEGSCTEPFYPDIAGDNSPSVPKLVYFPGAGP